MQTDSEQPKPTANPEDHVSGDDAREHERQRMDFTLDQLRELMRAVEEFGISELEIENDGGRVLVRRGALTNGAQQPVATQPIAPAPAPAPAPGADGASAPQAQPQEEEDPNVVYVTSPFVGTFFRSPSPTDAPYVDKGQDVDAGQTLCIVEAMKLMNEIEAEFACTILEIMVENGKPVEYGDRLFKVRKK